MQSQTHILTQNNDQVELTLLEELQVAMHEEHAAESSWHAVVRTTKMNTSETSNRTHVSAPWQDLSHQDPTILTKFALKQSFMTPTWQTSSHSGPDPQRSH